ncbi:hypothetical protein Pint_28930 [Pistacia integerrima]|uniref:Uncharacterized protein n=1 Tax=Pistacia integerrima TaxID=434235 RepID=A0ACC0WYR5_9ROSI|nr:hypothetical protein Pint_28930 [Pistacia integerrima]
MFWMNLCYSWLLQGGIILIRLSMLWPLFHNQRLLLNPHVCWAPINASKHFCKHFRDKFLVGIVNKYWLYPP